MPTGCRSSCSACFWALRCSLWAIRQKQSFGSSTKASHGLLLGLLRGQGKWKVRSNLESGTGYADIVVEIPQEKTGLVLEVKYAENGSLDSACKRAVEQIEKKQYEMQLKQDGLETIHKYGIACYKKKCKVLRG